jgi:hypothetical protein
MKIRNFLKSIEFLIIPITLFLLYKFVGVTTDSIVCSVIICDAYQISRSLYKYGRGMVYSSIFTSELYLLIFNVLISLYGLTHSIISPGLFCILLSSLYASFALGRGFVKKVRSVNKNMSMYWR